MKIKLVSFVDPTGKNIDSSVDSSSYLGIAKLPFLWDIFVVNSSYHFTKIFYYRDKFYI